MNKQYKSPSKRGIEWTDYTWNPIGGCFHACQWKMPGGKVANCYAEDVAEKFAGTAYPNGFEHHYWRPKALAEPGSVKTPSKIFAGSMADNFGHWVPEDQIRKVIDVCAFLAPWHQYQFLTKNVTRVKEFTIPKNVWIGASSPPDYLWNRELSRNQKERLLHKTLKELSEYQNRITWMSMEPYSWDMLSILKQYPGALNWVVVGAASDGPKQYPPDDHILEPLVGWLQENQIPTFFKGNLRKSPFAAAHWKEAFPVTYV